MLPRFARLMHRSRSGQEGRGRAQYSASAAWIWSTVEGLRRVFGEPPPVTSFVPACSGSAPRCRASRDSRRMTAGVHAISRTPQGRGCRPESRRRVAPRAPRRTAPSTPDRSRAPRSSRCRARACDRCGTSRVRRAAAHSPARTGTAGCAGRRRRRAADAPSWSRPTRGPGRRRTASRRLAPRHAPSPPARASGRSPGRAAAATPRTPAR